MDKQLTVLLVDDDAHTRRSLRRMLWMRSGDCAITVLEASSGEAAYELLKHHAVDCVLLDNNMPGTCGVDWIARFLEARPELGIIMVTGEGDESIAVKAMQAGATDYIVKGTLTSDQLMRAIDNALERIALKRAVAAQREQLIDAERQRVMVESLGAVCHHMGQPMTVITAYLPMIRDAIKDVDTGLLAKQCCDAADQVNSLLGQLQTTTFYRTESYLEPTGAAPHGGHILAL